MSRPSIDELISGIRAADRSILGRAITLVESTRPEDRERAEALIRECLPQDDRSFRIGITGAPGVGKSTLIDALGMQLVEKGRRVAVLAVDPTSGLSGGSILGDKTRMQQLAAHPNAFVRPSPSGGRSGGVAFRTREAILLCEAAGYETIFVETVGVGQAETAVRSMVDFFLLLALAGAGDELQGIKRGIMEMADAVVITKADDANKEAAKQASVQFQHALKIFPPAESGWTPRVYTCSAHSGEGLGDVLAAFERYEREMRSSSFFRENRRRQGRFWLRETIERRLLQQVYGSAAVQDVLRRNEKLVVDGKISASAAADAVLDAFRREAVRSA